MVSVTDADNKSAKPFVEGVESKHGGTADLSEYPTSKTINEGSKIVGPVKLKVKLDSKASRWSTNNFLVVFTELFLARVAYTT